MRPHLLKKVDRGAVRDAGSGLTFQKPEQEEHEGTKDMKGSDGIEAILHRT